jgi:ABC-type transporter Mla maintaining outer membrane lipid asymmetry permease subunit MlaE
VALTDAALAVANHNQSSEAKATTTLHNLCNTVDEDELFNQLWAFVFALVPTIATTATPASVIITSHSTTSFSVWNSLGAFCTRPAMSELPRTGQVNTAVVGAAEAALRI